jgi:hypothetical protein
LKRLDGVEKSKEKDRQRKTGGRCPENGALETPRWGGKANSSLIRPLRGHLLPRGEGKDEGRETGKKNLQGERNERDNFRR